MSFGRHFWLCISYGRQPHSLLNPSSENGGWGFIRGKERIFLRASVLTSTPNSSLASDLLPQIWIALKVLLPFHTAADSIIQPPHLDLPSTVWIALKVLLFFHTAADSIIEPTQDLPSTNLHSLKGTLAFSHCCRQPQTAPHSGSASAFHKPR